MNDFLLNILCCPNCWADLLLKKNHLSCTGCGKQYDIIDDIPIFTNSATLEWDVSINKKKWHNFYESFDWEKEAECYKRNNLPYIYNHIPPLNENDLFLELGCGASFLSVELARKKVQTLGVDSNLEILKLTKNFFSKYKIDGHLICAEFSKLPFKNNKFDFIAGIGVIEHSRDILKPLKEMHRIVKSSGNIFQTVPYLSLTSLLNSSIRFGTIPHLAFLKSLFTFIHVKLLKTRYMRCGYEESYTKRFLKLKLREADFGYFNVEFYDYNQTVFKKIPLLRNLFYYLIRLRLFHLMPFADLVYIKAQKGDCGTKK